jgi:AcrR family transcriptional regulator
MTDPSAPLPDSTGTRRKENTRHRLVVAARDVFVDKGIDGATVDDLVTAAGFTRGAFYSNFSTKEEVFVAAFSSMTEQVIGTMKESVHSALPGCAGVTGPRADDEVMLTVFEAIRPYGRHWYLLYSEAVARSLRDEEMRAELTVQRERLRDEVASLLERGLEQAGERAVLDVHDLAQLLVGIFVDLLLREQMDGRDITELATVTILGTLRAFVAPRDDTH